MGDSTKECLGWSIDTLGWIVVPSIDPAVALSRVASTVADGFTLATLIYPNDFKIRCPFVHRLSNPCQYSMEASSPPDKVTAEAQQYNLDWQLAVKLRLLVVLVEPYNLAFDCFLQTFFHSANERGF